MPDFLGIILMASLPYFASCGIEEDVSGGLGDLEISPTGFTHVEYGAVNLPVWQHRKNADREPLHRQYFTLPFVKLDPASAACISSVLRDAIILQVDVIMRSKEAESLIVSKLRQLTGIHNLTSGQLWTIPMERFRFVWKTNLISVSDRFLLDDAWQSYALKSRTVRVSIHTDSLPSCEKLRDNIRIQPVVLENLELQFVLRAKKAYQSKVVVKGQHLANSSLLASMRSLAKADGTILLRPVDITSISNEVVTGLMANRETDSGYIDSGDTLSLSKILGDALKMHPVTSAEIGRTDWSSVYWTPTKARPDVLINLLNAAFYKRDDADNRIGINKVEYNELLNALPSLSNVAEGSNVVSSSATLTGKQIRDWLQGNKLPSLWNGTQFVVKPVTLYRININAITHRRHIVSTDVQVYSNEHIYSIKPVIATVSTDGNQTAGLTTSALYHKISTLEMRTAILLEYKEITKQKLAGHDRQLEASLARIDAISTNLSNAVGKLKGSDEIAQAICSTMSGAWIYAVRRNCFTSIDCNMWCKKQPFMVSGGERNSNKRACIGSLHIHVSTNYTAKDWQVHPGDDASAYQVYNYRSCTEASCGPNYCCCTSV